MTLRRTLLAAAMALSVDCAPGPTEILVRIYSDLAPGPDLQFVVVSAQREGATTGISRTFTFGLTGPTMPGEWAILAADRNDARPLRVTVTGVRPQSSTPLPITQEALVRFQPGAITVLNMVLAAKCAGDASCSLRQTCGWNGCQDIERGALPEITDAASNDPGCTVCGGRCVDLNASHDHCGMCGNACPGNVLCVQGQCQCNQGAVCDGRCVSLEDTPDHCGDCDRRCDVACRAQRCEGADDLSAGGATACAILSDGTVSCWGASEHDQAGVEQTVVVRPLEVGARPDPTARRFLRAVSVGAAHACALGGSRVVCWGEGESGALGVGPTRDSPIFLGPRLPNPGAVEQVASGQSFSCALILGRVHCWGANDAGQAGETASMEQVLREIALPAGMTFRAVAAGGRHACAIADDGGVWCWGDGTRGQCGEGPAEERLAPRRVMHLPPARELSLGPAHSCAVAAGRVYCWGDNTHGALGAEGVGAAPRMAGSFDAAHVSAGGSRYDGLEVASAHTCAIDVRGTIFCWGANTYGQCARAPSARVPTPQALTVESFQALPRGGFVQIAAGATFTCVRSEGREVFCWGNNSSGQLGGGATTTTPSPTVSVVRW